jgi:hypothetical protein
MSEQLLEPIYLLTIQLALRWHMSRRTLERWRNEGKGPTWDKIGGRVLYRLSTIKEYESRQVRLTSRDR